MNAVAQNWYSVTVLAHSDAADAVEFVLGEMDCLGTETDHLGKKSGDDVQILGYFHEPVDIRALRDQLSSAIIDQGLAATLVRSVTTAEVQDRDWLAEWKKHWKPTVVGRFIIAPPWETVDETDKIVIRIEPNMAFGTGTHETTKLCLSEIETVGFDGMSVLDVGTGTGILAIATAKARSTAEVLACDTDRASVQIAHENAYLNGVGEKIRFWDGSISEVTGKFDLVLANLTIDVIVPILHHLLDSTNKFLILSGILVEQRPLIETALAKEGRTKYTIREMGEWISVTVQEG